MKLRLIDRSLRGLLAFAFALAGGAKLASLPEMVQLFAALGLGQWFRFVTGGLEIAAALLVIIPPTVVAGSALMLSILSGALIAHALIGGSAVPALILLLVVVALMWVRRRLWLAAPA